MAGGPAGGEVGVNGGGRAGTRMTGVGEGRWVIAGASGAAGAAQAATMQAPNNQAQRGGGSLIGPSLDDNSVLRRIAEKPAVIVFRDRDAGVTQAVEEPVHLARARDANDEVPQAD